MESIKKGLAFSILFVLLIGLSGALVLTGNTGTNRTITGRIGSETITTPNQTWLNFDGINQSVNKTINIIPPSNKTISIWINVKGNGSTNNPYIFSSDANNRLKIDYTYSSKVIGFILGNPGVKISSSATNLNEWINVIGTIKAHNSTYNNFSLYINGNLISNNIANETSKYSSYLYLGTISNAQYFNGSIDKLIIYNKTLNDDEVKRLYIEGEYNGNNGINFNSYFNLSNSVIDDRFYGVNTHGKYLSNNITLIDTNNDGNRETSSNQTWHRELFLDSGLKQIRIDMGLNDWINNSDNTYSPAAYLERNKETVKFASENNISVIMVSGYMPDWLANKTNECSKDNSTCGANNYTRYGDLLLSAINYYTSNGVYNSSVLLESWNEPFDHYLLENVATTFPLNKSRVLYDIHNTTYTRVKAVYPNMKVGANVVHFGYSINNYTYYRYDWFMANMTNKNDFLSIHLFRDLDLVSRFDNEINALYNNCTLYNFDCSNLIFTEFNVYNNTIKNISGRNYENQISSFYSRILNENSSRFNLLMYEWGTEYKYGSYYGNPWSMVSEPLLDNRIYSSYNVTKNFIDLCPEGSTVYSSSTNNNNFSIVSCKINNQYGIIVTNNGNNFNSIILNTNLLYLKDYITNEIYNSTNGIINLGLIYSNSTRYFIYNNLTSSYANPLSNNILIRYNLNENNGSIAYDTSGNGNNGVISGATWATDGATRTLTKGVDYLTNVSTYTTLLSWFGDYTLSRDWYSITYSLTEENPAATNESCESSVKSISNIIVLISLIFSIVIIGSIVFLVINGTIGFDNILSYAIGILSTILLSIMMVSILINNFTGGC